MKLKFWGGLGDEIAITGLVRELRRTWRQEKIEVVGNRYPELFLYNPHLAGDGVFDTGREITLPPAPNDTVGNFVRAYAQFCGLRTVASHEPELYLTEDEVGGIIAETDVDSTCVAIDTWAFWPRRRWPMDRFATLTKEIQARAWRVIEIGSTQPDIRGTRRTRRLPIDPSDCFLDLHTVRETAAVLSQCKAYIGNDSGLAHLAAAVGTPHVVLYTVPWYARAYRTTYPVQSLQHDCLGCAKTCVMDVEKSCLGSITVDDVLAVFDGVQGGTR